MTTMTPTEPQIWSTMPGWGIAADLTPPELIASRQLRLLRKVLGLALAIVLVLCVAGFALATMKHSKANSALTTEQRRTTQLNAQITRYKNVTTMENTVSHIDSKLPTIMAGDVDFNKTLLEIRQTLPGSMTILNETVTLSGAAVAGAGGGAGSVGSLDADTRPVIGRVTLSGTANTYPDLSAYVDALHKVPGFVDIVPTSAQSQGTGVAYNLSFNLTDEVLSHRFDTTKNGSGS